MADPINVLIQAAMSAQLTTPALTSPATPIAYAFVPFTPTPGVSFLQICPVLRAAPNAPGLNRFSGTMFVGVFQIDAVVPDGNGEAAGLRLASLVATRFQFGTVLLLQAGPNVKLQLNGVPTIAPAVKDAPWIRFPVSIPYFVTQQ